jgi:ComF family protein
MRKQISEFLNLVQDLLFPIFCLGCGLEGNYLCAGCEQIMQRARFQICPVCARRSAGGQTHEHCRAPGKLDGLTAAVVYKDPLAKKLVETCKYGMVKDLAGAFARVMAEEICRQIPRHGLAGFVLVPIPLHRKRLLWRGFNQAELIAKDLGAYLNLAIDPDCLTRSKFARPQAELKDKDRPLNVRGAFQAAAGLPGEKFLLVDDVANTRSTLNEACKALKSSGAKTVWAAVFAQG